jgi:hydrogenase/urease accessory protein HupE
LADRRRRFAFWFLSATGMPTAAFAHVDLETVPTFWSGALHVLVTPLAVATIVGLGAALARASDRAGVAAFGAIGGGAIAAGMLALPALADVAAGGTVIVGLAAAMVRRMPLAAAVLLSLVAGAAAGTLAAPPTPAILPALGTGFAAALLCLATVEIATRLPRPLQLAPRIIGAWVAAIGLLMGALALRASVQLATPAYGDAPWDAALRSIS